MQTTAAQIIADIAAVVGITNGPTLDIGSQENMQPKQASTLTTAANRVKNPIRSKSPPALITEITASGRKPELSP